MNLRQWFIDFFGFSKKETNGILVLLVLIGLLAILPRFYAMKAQRPISPDSLTLQTWYSTLLSMEVADSVSPDFSEYSKIQRKKDIGRKNYTQLRKKQPEPGMKLPPPLETGRSNVADQVFLKEDINTATADQLMQVNGIGPVLSERILKFRDRMGGFYSLDQLADVYGLEKEVISRLSQRFEIQSGIRKSVMINADSVNQLVTHPMITYKLAWSILNYRKTHGDYTEAAQLKQIKGFPDSLYQRIYPYISLQPGD